MKRREPLCELPEFLRTEQFQDFVLDRLEIGKADDCWSWTKKRTGCGYGQIVRRKICLQVHRVVWMIAVGKIPRGLEVCHRCDNPPCCNPDHLYLATHAQNMRDASDRKRFGNVMRGHQCTGSKLVEQDVINLRELHKDFGLNYAELGRLFRITPMNARKICLGIKWKHLPV